MKPGDANEDKQNDPEIANSPQCQCPKGHQSKEADDGVSVYHITLRLVVFASAHESDGNDHGYSKCRIALHLPAL